MPSSPNPLNQTKPLDFQIAKLQNDVEALEKENQLLEQSHEQANQQNKVEISSLQQDNRELKKQAQQIAICDPQKIQAQESLKYKQCLELKSQLDHLCAKKQNLQRQLDQQLKDNPYVNLSDQKQRGRVDFQLGEVEGLDRIRELETGIDEAEVRLREARQIKQTYENIKKQIAQESVYYEERIRRQRQDLQKTTQEFERFTQVCDQAVAATEQKQQEHASIAEYCTQNRELRRQQLEEHRASVKGQLEKTAQLDTREEVDLPRTQAPKSAHKQTRQATGYISQLYYEKILALHNFKSPTEFVNACKNQAVVNDDLNDQEEAHARIKKLNQELLETQQAIQDCQYDLESAGALQKKIIAQAREQIQVFQHENQFKAELMQAQLIKLNNVKNALVNTAQKLPLIRVADAQLAQRTGIDQFRLEEMQELAESPEQFDRIVQKIPDINKQCEFVEAVTLFRLVNFREALEAADTTASENVVAQEEAAHDTQEAEQHDDYPQLAENPALDPKQQTTDFADDLYIQLDDDDELPIDDLQLNEANVKIQFPRSRPSSKPPLGRGKSGKAVAIGDVPQHLRETLDRKAMKQQSLALVEANKQPIKEE